jgi:hypothetical protein
MPSNKRMRKEDWRGHKRGLQLGLQPLSLQFSSRQLPKQGEARARHNSNHLSEFKSI